MEEIVLFLSTFLLVFLTCIVIGFCLRLAIWLYFDYCPEHLQQEQQQNLRRRCNRRARRICQDRQGNIFTISDDASLNSSQNRYADFFYIEPSGNDATRIRAQQEKDDKDLPSYEEVMGMSGGNATVLITAPAGNINPLDVPPAPPYTEVDAHNAPPPAPPPPVPTVTTTPAASVSVSATMPEASTSRAATSAGEVTITMPCSANK